MALTYLQHQDDVLHMMGDFTGATRAKVKVWINTSYRQLWEQVYGRYKEESDYLSTSAAYESTSAITVTVTNASTTVTSDGATDTVFTSAMVGRFIQLNGTDPWYRIASLTSATEIELEDAYLGDSDTACAFKVHTYRWSLPSGVDRVMQVIAELDECTVPLEFVDRQSVRNDWSRPLEWDTGTPDKCWIEEKDSAGVYQLAIWPPPTSASLIQIWHEKSVTDLSADSDTIAIPGGDSALNALSISKAMAYKGRMRETQYFRQVYETELQRLLNTVVRGRGMSFRHKDRSNAHGHATGINLGPQFPRVR